MNSWNPEALTNLSLPNTRLTSFHVGTLVQLENLDLSNNMLTTLLGSGLEQLQQLKTANFSNNRVIKKRQLVVFQ